MSYHWSDNVHTTAFTPRDYQVELLASAFERNVIVCLCHKSSKEFIALKLIQELAGELRKSISKKLTIYICDEPESSPHDLIHHLTDLKVLNIIRIYDEDDDDELPNIWDYQVIICDAFTFSDFVNAGLKIEDINLIVIEDCHKYDLNPNANLVLPDFLEQNYLKAEERPRILGLAGPFHKAHFNDVGFAVKILEDLTFCEVETTSDIVTVLRYCTKPIEYVIQCAPPNRDEFVNFLEEIVQTRMAFLEDHRFDPSEIYSDEFSDELKDIPDPKKEPKQFLYNYIRILHEMGPWCADRAALNLLTQIEKQKVKTPYERHFLLLCLVSTTLVEIRAQSDYVFQKIENEKDRVEKYSTPKVLRLFEILRKFKPDEKTSHDNLAKASDEIENLDFRKLQIELEKTFQSIDNEDNKNNVTEVVENLENILHSSNRNENKNPEEIEVKTNTTRKDSSESILKTRRTNGNRQKRKHFSQGGRNRHNNNNSADPDALYGIIFCNRKNTAKVLFDLLCEMSRHDPDLTFLNVQYTVDRVADPLTEPKEAELEHRRQEEVLKRFRMHECNLLIGTAVLEEGIDLPKCNLVIRWDRPDSYRSYVQCKGRARAQKAYHVILVAANLNPPIDALNGENLSDKSHRYMCISSEDNEANRSISVESEETEISETDKLPSCTDMQKNGEHKIIEEDGIICEIKETDEKINTSKTISKNGSMKNNEKVYFEVESIEELLNSSTESCSVSKKPKGCVVKITEETQNNDNTDLIGKIDSAVDVIIGTLAEYREVEKLLLLKCANGEPSEDEHQEADKYTNFIEPYKPVPELLTGAYVDLGTSIALINKYCAKLPSDTFTKLTPLWRCTKTIRNDNTLYLYSLRMPINSPLKHDIQGLPMPSKVLGRRMVALMACRELHKCGELDDNLQPIGKEGFKASEPDWEDFELEKLDEQIVNENSEPRPGTTKRRQYYYKRIASEFSECRPTAGSEAYLYIINMTLQCPIPEEQNTRGRRIYPPEEAPQGFGILTLKKIPKVSSFPIFTRSGEVKVSTELSKNKIILTDDQILRINAFVNYTFTNVLRLQKYLMLFDSEAMENCVYIVPTMKSDNDIFIDWDFLEQIYINSDKIPRPIPEDERKNIEFDPNKFKDAVVMPWYRNQDQPQYFYVAEICYHLTPESCFPGENYRTFQEYYFRKYSITIQNSKQPLLDVDHTSARLNFLTPRYVNRKGVALPTSSEETKRAKRENLEQKQILVPELCTIHPFPASLWRAAVCLPCILYRINGLLLADEIRKKVSYDLGLGKMELGDDNFEWPTLHFGWSLAEVLKKSREAKQFTKSNSIEKSKNHQGYDAQLGKDVSDIKKREVDIECEKLPENSTDEKTANDLLEEADEKLKGDCLMEIGTWSNDMANNIGGEEDIHDNEDWGILPPNVNLCSTNNTNIRYGSPTSWDVGATSRQRPIENYFTDSDASFQSDDDYDLISTESSDDQTGPFRIEFKSNNVAEAIDTEEEILKMQKQLTILENTAYNEREYQRSKNDICGYEFFSLSGDLGKIVSIHTSEYMKSVAKLKSEMLNRSDMVVSYDKQFEISRKANLQVDSYKCDHNLFVNFLHSIFGMPIEWIKKVRPELNDETCKSTIDHLQNLNALLTSTTGPEKYVIEGSGDIFDNFNDYTITAKGNTKEILIDFQISNINKELCKDNRIITENITDTSLNDFSFDYQPDLLGHPGPSPSIILQALTMSNANDGINLERLETIGDSFLKYAITTYLYCTYEDVHEGKLSHLRSKQVSNLNLYRLGRRKVLGECMIATKFEPHDNWLPPCYYVPKELEKALIEAKIPACHWNLADLPNIKDLSSEEICELVKKKAESLGLLDDDDYDDIIASTNIDIKVNENFPCFIPYNLVTQHSIPDKSVADCVEALIGAYLIECGPRGALLFMAWLGIRVLPIIKKQYNPEEPRIPGSTRPNDNNEIIIYGDWIAPKSPLLTFAPEPYKQLDTFLDGYSEFEKSIGYNFRDRSYLLQAMTHASYSPNRLTDCYQRLEFLGDAVLDYLITRHLYEDPRQHSPGALTDLRSALVNNTIFASLAVRHGFHKYFKHLSPGLNEVIDRFVRIQHENGHSISEEYYLLSEEECDDAEDVEVPKALGDVFESVAGAIFLDSNMSLDIVWKVYSNMMKPEIEQFSNSVPKSPIRELLELEPETAKFGKPEKLADGRRVRVTVDVFGKGTFRGIGRNYRIAKCTAAKCALRQLKKQGLISKKH